MTELRGITWNHTRGYLPMVATAQRFSELNSSVSIVWEKRSLQHFADYPLERLIDLYDLLVIDHPSVGYASKNNLLLPLDEHLPQDFLDDQADNSVGQSHRSYTYGGHQWALATDAATPICGYRPDLRDKHGVDLPETWEDLIELARRGLVAVSGIGIDSLCHFYMLCGALGEDPFENGRCVVSNTIGVKALERLRELITLAVPGCSQRNPIAVWELLTSSDEALICPFAYGYSNYGRTTYCTFPLRFSGLVKINGSNCRSTLGGAGLAISAHSKQPRAAADYCLFAAGEQSQCGVYFTSGGQPGYRKAWLDDRTNLECNGFFRDTLPTLDAAWVRPRWNGYLDFQDGASEMIAGYVRHGGEPEEILDRMNKLLCRAQAGNAE